MHRDDILAKLRERIVAYAASRLTRDLADDLAQDVLLVLHQKYHEVTELPDLIPLAFQVLRFKMLDLQRKRHRRGEYNQESIHDLPLADPHDNPATALEHKQVMDRLITSIERLGPRCRDLFRLKFEGKSFPEIQSIMAQRSINTIYTWDLRCRKQLLDLMGGRWD